MKSIEEQAQDFITENYDSNNWGLYPPSRRLVGEWLTRFAEAKLREAAEKNFEKYRQYTDASEKEPEERNALKLKEMARGFKYAAKQTLSLIPTEKPNKNQNR